MSQKGSNLPLTIIGIFLIIIAIVVGLSIVGNTREQLAQGIPFNDVFTNYISQFIIAIVLMVIGLGCTILGVKK